jgi:hypothetical protein
VYFGVGVRTVPVPHRSKNPGREGWQNLRIDPQQIDEHFPAGTPKNIGALLGEVSGNLADVDLDCVEAIKAGCALLPPTGWVFGRKSAPASHYEYRVVGNLKLATYDDTNGKRLVELRYGTGLQTIFPPSIHGETGEPICWEKFDELAEVPSNELRAAVGRVAGAALLARHWPAEGGRHDAALALAGGLLRAGWKVQDVRQFMGAVVTAANDDELKDRLKAVDTTASDIAGGEKVTGWPVLAQIVGDEVVNRVLEWLGIRNAEPVVVEEASWPNPPANQTYHGLAGAIVLAIEPSSEASAVALLVQVLVCFGSIVGRRAYYTVEGTRHHPNEYAVLVGRTSKARKGTSWDRVHRLFGDAEPEWAADRVQSGLSSGEGLIWAVRDPITKRERVKERGEPVRYEDVESDPGVTDKRLSVYEPEFANVLKQTERQGNTLSSVIRQGWDGTNLRTITKNSPARATGAHVSLIGHITAEELRRYLTETESANGFGNRFLWVCVDRSKLLPEGGQIDPAVYSELVMEIKDSLAFASGVGEVRLDDQARAIWYDVYGSLSEGKPGLAGALLGRAEAHVIRLAMIYALMDRSRVIGGAHLLAAVALWDYCEGSVGYIFGDSLGDDVADELLRLFRGCPSGMTRTEIRDYFQRHVSAGRIGKALGLLLQHHLARREQVETGGRPAERWYATDRRRGE